MGPGDDGDCRLALRNCWRAAVRVARRPVWGGIGENRGGSTLITLVLVCRVQNFLERHSDWVYGAAAFFVTLAICILVFTPTAIEVGAWAAGPLVLLCACRLQVRGALGFFFAPAGYKYVLPCRGRQISPRRWAGRCGR